MDQRYFEAAAKGETRLLAKFIEDGVDINSKDEKGRTAAMIATYKNDPATIAFLIDKDADINLQDDLKNNPFLYAGAEGYLEVLKQTIEAGANPAILNRYGGTALIPASEHGYTHVVRELLEKTDINVNHINNLGWTALLEAIILNDGGEKQQETVKLLIEHGADITIPDREGVTPLQHAREMRFKEIADILIKAGAK